MKWFARFCLLLGGLLIQTSVLALDVLVLEEPTPLTDSKVAVGSRTLSLPEGDWVYIGKHMSEFTIEGRPNSKIANVYLVKIKDKRLEASVFLSLPVQSLNYPGRTTWSSSRCDDKDGFAHKEVFGWNRAAPACHFVYAHDNHLKSDQPLFKGVKLWMDVQKIKNTAPFSVSFYTKISENEIGEIYVFLPMSNNHSLETLASWGKELHKNLQGFFERRTNSATLPALP